jgi:hypothetical protein
MVEKILFYEKVGQIFLKVGLFFDEQNKITPKICIKSDQFWKEKYIFTKKVGQTW